MRHLFLVPALLVPAMLLGAPALAQPKVGKGLDKNADKWVKIGVLVGKVSAVYEAKKTIRLDVATSYVTLSGGRYQVHSKNVPVEVEAVEDAVVRVLKPKEEFDDKGKVKKLTRKELKELKGPNPRMIGYKAEFGDIQTDQIVRVQLVRKKDAPRPKPKRGKFAKEDPDALADNLPQVSMIVILFDPANIPPPKVKGKR
jgi:hypothetical protein